MILECNGKNNPLGVSRNHIRLGFKIMDEKEMHPQKKNEYEFQISVSEEKLKNNKAEIVIKEDIAGWHSTIIMPELLRDRTKYYWRVAEYDIETENVLTISEIGYFETGISEWRGEWICGWINEDKNNNGHIQNFRRKFVVDGDIEEARLYICGLGYFDANINGNNTDDLIYKPLVTDYMKRVHPENPTLYESTQHRMVYYTYDVKDFLCKGENILRVDVADGYFYNMEKVEYAYNFSFGSPRLIYDLYIKENGSWKIIKSDTDTLVCNTNKRALLYAGDIYDYSTENENYKKSFLIDNETKMVSSLCQEDKVCEILEPIKIIQTENGFLYDFGVNHTGGLSIRFEADEKTLINITYAEILDLNGNPNYETSVFDERSIEDGREDGLEQRNVYTIEKGITDVKPTFTWKCYRYAFIRITGKAKINEIKSLFIHMNMERDGYFDCSDDILNKINEMFVQTAYCNLHSGLLTDCPHREKRPYTGDGNMVMKSIFYNLDSIPFFYKWLDDMEDSRVIDGKITNTVPNFGGGGGYAWGNAICTLTKELYRYTGDINALKRGYNIIKGWIGYYKTMTDANHIVRSNGAEWLLGDWLAPDIVVSNVYYINTCCYYEAVETAEYIAKMLGMCNDINSKLYNEEEKEWKVLKNIIKENINKIFFDSKKLTYGNGVQGEDVLALALKLVPDEYTEELKQKMENHYRNETNYHLDTGIILTPVLIDYLTINGYEDIAYKIMTAKTYPSYYNLMENDTTFSEHWSKKWPDFYVGEIGNSKIVKGGGELSHCHPMYGSVVAWLYEKVAGINLSELFRQKVNFNPYFTEYLSEAKAYKNTPYGQIGIKWNNGDNILKIETVLPNNLTGRIYFPTKYGKIKCLNTGAIYIAKNGYFDIEVNSGKMEFQTV